MITQVSQGNDFEKNDKKMHSNDVKLQDGVDYAIELNRKIANVIGIWPTFSKDKVSNLNFEIVSKRIKNTIFYFLLAFILVPGIFHIVLEERTFKRKIMKTGPMILNSMALIKYTMTLTRERKIRKCLKLMKLDWEKVISLDKASEWGLMRESANVGRRLTRVCAVTFYGGMISYRLIKTLSTPVRVTPSGLVIRPLPSPLYGAIFGGLNCSASPVYELIFAVQLLAGFAVHSTTITTCSYAAVFATHACGQFDIIMDLLNKLISRKSGEVVDVNDKFKFIVKRHLKVLRFLGDVEELLHEICLVEIVGGTLLLCLTAYYFIMDWENNDAIGLLIYTIMIISVVAMLFTYCYIGELVTDKAKSIGTECYMINWYELPPKKGLYLGMIISVSRDPMKLTAGKIFELSMHNFGTIMRTAASYLNLLRTVAE